ncbi:MAG TPA: hypothetical protein VK914_05880 [bacterium]|jgi:hypothetical protein|nr:hypothetical protein [bacterium]
MKPQDVVVLAALLSRPANERETLAVLASRSGLSASETHASLKRLRECRLIDGSDDRPWKSAVMEFFAHGLRYAFPVRPGGIVYGLATGSSAPPLNSKFAANSTAWVWPWEGGNQKGESIRPLYATAPRVCAKDPVLWEWLSLLDALRAGAAREQKAALKELEDRLGVPAL